MVTGPFPYEPPEPPPVSPPPPTNAGRPASPLTLAVAALVVAGGIAGGALGAEAILNRTPAAAPAAVTRSASTSSVAQAQTPMVAPAIYQQAAPGVVTITTSVAGRFGRVGGGTEIGRA